nr:uncharacterized protein I303_01623 [Kwoniella dejecticola CBS 10117]OBR87421.1 hypothetical protein I303_01623 [Kwoniella dejecticola CBS 10117]
MTKRRTVLGERSENVISNSPKSLSVKSKSNFQAKSPSNTRITPNSLSRFIAKSPVAMLPRPTRDDYLPSSSPVGKSPNASFTSRPGSTPYLPRQSMSMQLNEDDTLLLNMRPPEMGFSMDMTDESDVEDPRGGVRARGGLMTPANSQEVTTGSPLKTIRGKQSYAPSSVTRNPISRLPTPPSSQSGSYPTELPPTPQAGPSKSRVRARPSPTPPRRIQNRPADIEVGFGDVTAEWDTPLRMGDDVSPNPRKKKSPRLSQPGQTPTKTNSKSKSKSISPESHRIVEIVIPLRSRSKTPSQADPKTPATVRAKKGRSSTRTPSLPLTQSQTSSSSRARRRTSGESATGSRKSQTPAPASGKVIPSTAPSKSTRRKSTISPDSVSTARKRTPPSSGSAQSRRASVPANINTNTNTKTPKAKPRGRKSLAALTQTPKDIAFSGRKFGTLPRPIHGSPGDDPLLLTATRRERTAQGIRDGRGLALDFESGPSSSNSRSRSPAAAAAHLHTESVSSPFDMPQNDLTLLPMNSGYMDLGAGAWSDDGSDMDVGDDTFIHVHQRKDRSGLLSNLGGSLSDQSEEEDGNANEDDGKSQLVHNRPFLPLTSLDVSSNSISREDEGDEERRANQTSGLQAESAEDNDMTGAVENAVDVTQEPQVEDWDVSNDSLDSPIESVLQQDAQTPPEDHEQQISESNEDIVHFGPRNHTLGPSAGSHSNIEVSSTREIEVTMQDEIADEDYFGQPENIAINRGGQELEEHHERPNGSQQANDILIQAIHRLAGEDQSISPSTVPQASLQEANLIAHSDTRQTEFSDDNKSPEDTQVSEKDQLETNRRLNETTDFPALPACTSTGLLENQAIYEKSDEPSYQDTMVLGLRSPSRSSSSAHTPQLSESEEIGDITQDMDVLDWEVSEEDIVTAAGATEPNQKGEEETLETLSASAEQAKEDPVGDYDQPQQKDLVSPAAAQISESQTPQSEAIFSESKPAALSNDNNGNNGASISDAEEEGADQEIDANETCDPESSRSVDGGDGMDSTTPTIPSIALPSGEGEGEGEDQDEDVNQAQAPISPISRSARTPSRSRSPAPAPAPSTGSVQRSTTPIFSPPPPSSSRKPFVLIHHRGDLTFTPKPSFSYTPTAVRSPSPLPPPTPVFTSEERGHRVLEEADRALRRLSKLRSLSPLPLPTSTSSYIATAGESLQDAVLQSGAEVEEQRAEEVAVQNNESAAQQTIMDPTASEEHDTVDNAQESPDSADDRSIAGNTTIEAEAENPAWDLSTEEYEVPLKDETNETNETDDENEAGRPENSASALHPPSAGGAEAQGEIGEEEQEDADEEEESPEPIEIPERIVLKLVERGIIKLEPGSDCGNVSETENDEEVTTNELDRPIEAENDASSANRREIRSPAQTRSPVSTCTSFARPSTPSIYPVLPSAVSSTPKTAPPPAVSSTPKTAPPPALRYPHAQLMPEAMTDMERTLSYRFHKSKLSKEVLPSSSPAASSPENPAHSADLDPVSNEEDDEDQAQDRSIVVRKPRKSLHDELAAVASRPDAEGSFEGDQSFRSVVEVSSLDPKAAARAAAILKLNHAYIEHGHFMKSGEKDLTFSSTSRKSVRDLEKDQEKRELLHEAELEIVESHRRSRSRSRSMSTLPLPLPQATPVHNGGSKEREREMSVMSFMTEDYPVPGAFVKTPTSVKRKRNVPWQSRPEPDSVSAPAPQPELNPKVDEKWGVSEWKQLEKVYRTEKELWIKEREIKNLPGGLVAWARRSTFGRSPSSSAVSDSASKSHHVKDWDMTRVVDRFVEDQTTQGLSWDKDMLLLRVQAIEKRVSKLSCSTASSSSSTTYTSGESHTPTTKKARTAENMTTPSVDKTVSASSMSTTIEPPSTIRRMISLVWGKGKEKSTPISTSAAISGTTTEKQQSKHAETFLDRLEQSKAANSSSTISRTKFVDNSKEKGKGKGRQADMAILPISQSPMREIPKPQSGSRPVHPSSPQWKSIPPPPPPPLSRPHTSASTPRPDSDRPAAGSVATKTKEAGSTPSSSGISNAMSMSTSKSLPSLSSISSSSLSTDYTSTGKLYPPLNPPISQRSSALAKLFPSTEIEKNNVIATSKISSSTSAKSLGELEKVRQRKSSNASVKSLVQDWEGKGMIGSTRKP